MKVVIPLDGEPEERERRMSLTVDCGEGRHDVCSGSGDYTYLFPQLAGESFECGCRCHVKEAGS